MNPEVIRFPKKKEQEKVSETVLVNFVQKENVKPTVSRSLSVPGRNIVIVRSISFAARNENIKTDPSDGM